MRKLPKYEKKIRIRTGKRVARAIQRVKPQMGLAEALDDAWQKYVMGTFLFIEKIWRKK